MNLRQRAQLSRIALVQPSGLATPPPPATDAVYSAWQGSSPKFALSLERTSDSGIYLRASFVQVRERGNRELRSAVKRARAAVCCEKRERRSCDDEDSYIVPFFSVFLPFSHLQRDKSVLLHVVCKAEYIIIESAYI